MAWHFPDGTEPIDDAPEVAELEEALQGEAQTASEEDLPPVSEATEVDYQSVAQSVDGTTPTQTEGEPFAILKVYGKYIPVQTKEELINLAQQGIDYDNKMYKLREWREVIQLVEENQTVQELVRRALRKEDVDDYVNFDGISKAPADAKQFKEYLKKQVESELTPYRSKIDELEKELFFTEMRSKDPQMFDTVFALCKEVYAIPDGSPNAIPLALKKQINEDKEVFKIFYNFMRDKVIAYQRNQAQPVTSDELKPRPEQDADSTLDRQVTSGVTLKRSVRKAPILETGRDNSRVESSQLTDAEKIWQMPSSKFQELIKRAESGYKR